MIKVVVIDLDSGQSVDAPGVDLVVIIASEPDPTTNKQTVNTLVHSNNPEAMEPVILNLVAHLVRYGEESLGLLLLRENLIATLQTDPHRLKFLR